MKTFEDKTNWQKLICSSFRGGLGWSDFNRIFLILKTKHFKHRTEISDFLISWLNQHFWSSRLRKLSQESQVISHVFKFIKRQINARKARNSCRTRRFLSCSRVVQTNLIMKHNLARRNQSWSFRVTFNYDRKPSSLQLGKLVEFVCLKASN